MVNYMNLVANATDENGVAWKEYTSAQNEGYAQMFATYSTATALNSVAIQRMMDDLYKSLALNTVDSLAKAIRKAILDSHYATLESGDVTLVAGLQNFPQRLSLPAGAFTVAYDGTNKAFGANGAASYGGFSTAAVNSYVYPASLWYYANTKIKTSNTSEKDHYVANASWASILGAYANDDASVNTLTRSIALKDTIQYAVARLDVKVKTKANNYLEDNDPIAANNKVENPTNGYQVTAVLVGNQHNVGFDFTPESYQGSDAVYFTIFDSIMPTNMKTSTEAYSAINSTLVLESEAGDSASNIAKDVYVAIELINSSTKDFYGAGGCIIPMGSRFYLVGKLESKKSTVKDADNNIIQRVFIQDYTTTAAFSIKDLKNAYNTIPDLRAPQLEIGMSVDLQWSTGTTYEVEL